MLRINQAFSKSSFRTIRPWNERTLLVADYGESRAFLLNLSSDQVSAQFQPITGDRKIQCETALRVDIHGRPCVVLTDYNDNRILCLHVDEHEGGASGPAAACAWINQAPGLHQPWGALLYRDELLVSEYGSGRVQSLNPTTGTLKRIMCPPGEQRLCAAPMGMIADDHGRIYIADWKANQIRIVNAQGALIGTLGEKGSKPGQLHLPYDVAVHRSTFTVFVADYNNSRVAVFDGVRLTFLHNIPLATKPFGLCVFNNDVLYVTLHSNEVIRIDLAYLFNAADIVTRA